MRHVFNLLFIAIVVAARPTGANAAGSKTEDDAREYTQKIAEVQAKLAAKDSAAAAKLLKSTNAEQRSFEFEYLYARLQSAKREGAAADLVQSLDYPKVNTRYGVLNEQGHEVVFICQDGSLHVYDLRAPKSELKTAKHPEGAAIWSGAFSHDGKTFATGHQNGDVLVWDPAKWTIRHTIKLPGGLPVRELAVSPDGKSVVVEGEKQLELWSIAGDKAEKVADVGERLNFGEGLAFSPKGDLIATGGMFDIILHDAKTGAETSSMRHASYTMGLEFSPDGQRVASAPRGNVNKFLAIFDVGAKEPAFNAGPFGNFVAGMAFTPDGKRLAATGCENRVRLFDTTTGSVLVELKRTGCSAKPAFTRSSRLLGWSEPSGYKFIDLGEVDKKQGEDTAKK